MAEDELPPEAGPATRRGDAAATAEAPPSPRRHDPRPPWALAIVKVEESLLLALGVAVLGAVLLLAAC